MGGLDGQIGTQQRSVAWNSDDRIKRLIAAELPHGARASKRVKGHVSASPDTPAGSGTSALSYRPVQDTRLASVPQLAGPRCTSPACLLCMACRRSARRPPPPPPSLPPPTPTAGWPHPHDTPVGGGASLNIRPPLPSPPGLTSLGSVVRLIKASPPPLPPPGR